MKTSELTKLLKEAGCLFLAHRGNHDYWYSPITKKKIPVPRHPSKEIPTGTAEQILKQAGLK